MGTEFPWRWGRGTISANLDVIWGIWMSSGECRCGTEISMLTQCRREGIPVPVLARTDTNELFGAIGDVYFLVTKFIDGSLLPKFSHDSARIVARTLGAIHRVQLSSVKDPYYYTNEIFQKSMADKRNQLGEIAPLVDAGLEAGDRLAKVSMPKHVTHCELRPRHLIQAPNGAVYVLDFERTALEPRPFDLSRCFLFFCARTRLSLDNSLYNSIYREYRLSTNLSDEEKGLCTITLCIIVGLIYFSTLCSKAAPQASRPSALGRRWCRSSKMGQADSTIAC